MPEVTPDPVPEALDALGLDPATPTRRLRGFSGVAVVGLRVDGRPAVLKVTPRTMAGSRRELRCYQELAAGLPVLTPALLAMTTTVDLVVLLLDGLRPPLPARDWPAARWQEVVRQLGALHGTAVDPAARQWLRDHLEPVASELVARRRELWAELPANGTAAILFDELPACRRARAALPRCLVHGDCHAENLLTDAAGGLVWIDWQEVGLGSGAEDLALLWQRAEFNGALVPRAETLATYAAARGIPLDATLTRAVRAAEIELLLLGWPEFLLRDPAQPRERLFGRLHDLVDSG